MSEFLEYIRQLHYKIVGKPHQFSKPRGEELDYDSINELTDLEEEGILATSLELLPKNERKRLTRYLKGN
jgi:hypothetical protein